MEKVVCPKCGSSNFKVLMEQVLRDVHNNTRVDKGFEYTDASIEGEKFFEVVCLNCGERLVQANEPKCPKCGAPLEVRKFIDTWDCENKPLDINEDFYCPKCDIRWLRESGPHNFYEG
ncbi:MAG: hypothetical protein QXJ07_05510 [Candidatus Bathyarchaeia archaeon]